MSKTINSQTDKSLDEIDNILFEAIESAASYTHQVTAEEADYIQSVARQQILALKSKWETEARIDELESIQTNYGHMVARTAKSGKFGIWITLDDRIKELGDK